MEKEHIRALKSHEPLAHLNLPPLIFTLVPTAAGVAVRGSFFGLRQRPSAVLLQPPLPLVPPSQHVSALTGLQRAVHLIRERIQIFCVYRSGHQSECVCACRRLH